MPPSTEVLSSPSREGNGTAKVTERPMRSSAATHRWPLSNVRGSAGPALRVPGAGARGASREACGFTLLEVVVAVAILGLGVGLALELFSGGLNNMRRVDLAHRAMFHAENIMSEVLADETAVGPTMRSGDLDDDFGYQVTVDYWHPPEEAVLALESDQPRPELLSVVVEVLFKNDPNGKMYRVASLKTVMPDLGPEGLNPGNTSDVLRQLFQRNQ